MPLCGQPRYKAHREQEKDVSLRLLSKYHPMQLLLDQHTKRSSSEMIVLVQG